MTILWIIASILFLASLALQIYSLVKKDDMVDTVDEIEELNIDTMRELAQVKDRLEAIEDYLGFNKRESSPRNRVTSIVENQIIKLFTRGAKEEDIARELNITEADAKQVIDAYIAEGVKESKN